MPAGRARAAKKKRAGGEVQGKREEAPHSKTISPRALKNYDMSQRCQAQAGKFEMQNKKKAEVKRTLGLAGPRANEKQRSPRRGSPPLAFEKWSSALLPETNKIVHNKRQLVSG